MLSIDGPKWENNYPVSSTRIDAGADLDMTDPKFADGFNGRGEYRSISLLVRGRADAPFSTGLTADTAGPKIVSLRGNGARGSGREESIFVRRTPYVGTGTEAATQGMTSVLVGRLNSVDFRFN